MCATARPQPAVAPTSRPTSGASLGQQQQQQPTAQRGAPRAAGCHTQLAAARFANHQLAALQLGSSSASHPDFMFGPPLGATPTQVIQHHQPGGPFTGPPYLAASVGFHQQPLLQAANNSESLAADASLRANFALLSKPAPTCATSAGCCGAPIGTAELLAGRRARYGELLGTTRNCSAASARKEGSRASALLRVTRKLLKLGSRQARGGNSRRRRSRHLAASAGCYSSTNNSQVSSTGESNAGGAGHQCGSVSRRANSGNRGMSPTSSLSTLIRKFNHDNYTSVCQQYERRKQQLARRSPLSGAAHSPSEGACQEPEALLIDGLDCQLSASAQPEPKQLIRSDTNNQQQQQQQQTPPFGLLDEEGGVFCRKGGLYYNYSLEAAPADDARPPKAARVNPMLQGTKCAFSAANESATKQQSEVEPSKVNEGLLLDEAQQVASEQQQSESKPLKRSKNSLNCLQRQQQQQPTTTKQAEPNLNVEQQQLRAAEPMKQEEREQQTKQKTKQETKLEKQLNRASSNQKQTPKSGACTTSTASSANNETIISNITSVQELLDKMNGIMEGGFSQLEADSKGLAASGQANQSESNNKQSIDHWSAKRSSSSSRQQAVRQSSVRMRANRNNTSVAQPDRTADYNCDTLDFGSLRSVEDAMSLVSVSSEFEYHDIEAAEGPKSAARGRNSQIGAPSSPEAPLRIATPLVEPAAAALLAWRPNQEEPLNCVNSSRLEDLRFPSFLPTKKEAAAAAAAAALVEANQQRANKLINHKSQQQQPGRANQTRTSSGERQPQAQRAQRPSSLSSAFNATKASSSLLNLTAAKFANQRVANQPGASSAVAGQTKQAPLSSKLTCSSNTITKQRAVKQAPMKARVLTLSEFGRDGAECSLPAESGNVRARIRKMEQQSTPNLANNQHSSGSSNSSSSASTSTSQQQQQQQQVNVNQARNQLRPANSMIPVTANASSPLSSKLPVLAQPISRPVGQQTPPLKQVSQVAELRRPISNGAKLSGSSGKLS